MFHVFQEASPHDLWNCEYPGCSVTFVPYFVWGVRHHCRVCGITVCHDHCAKNITLSSRLLQPIYTELSSIQTPILATSLHQTDLPQQLTFKYACFTCTSRTVHPQPPPTASSEQSEAETLRTQLAQLKAELASKTSDVTALSDMMHVYSERLVSLQDTIETLESQLRENNTESATNVKKRRQLSELRDELQRLTPMHSYYNADCEEIENDGANNVNYSATKYVSPPYKTTNSAYNSAPEEPSVSTMFYSMLSQAYEGIVAVTPLLLRSTAYTTVDTDSITNTKTNTTSTSNNYNRQHPNAQQSIVDHSVLHRGTVSAAQVNGLDHTACELTPATPVRVLFPPCDSAHNTSATSDASVDEVHSIGEMDLNSGELGTCVISSTNTSTAICAVISDDSACFSRAQSAHVEYYDIYACISADEYMTHSVVRLESRVPPTPVRSTVGGNGAWKDSGDRTSSNSGERSVESVHRVHKSKVNVMEGVFIPNPLMTKRKSI